jgi:hypothetical protein
MAGPIMAPKTLHAIRPKNQIKKVLIPALFATPFAASNRN